MRAFLTRTWYTLILFTVGTLAFICFVHFVMKYYSDFTIHKATKYVIFGHSHPECAFDDSLIANFKNLSKSGESYFYTYQKVKQILSKNKLEAVFIEFSNNQISKDMDEWIWGFDSMNINVPLYAPFMEVSDLLLLYDKNKEDVLKIVSTSTRKNFVRMLLFDYSMSKKHGRYNRLERNRIKALIEEREKHPDTDTVFKKNEFSSYNIKYLEKIVDYCSKKNTKVYFVRSPQHAYYPHSNESDLLKIKNTKFKDIVFLDFDTFPLKEEAYGDFGHLNYKGAKRFSLWFNMLIQHNLLGKLNKAEFITSEMEKLKL